jgi:hypothetical protein
MIRAITALALVAASTVAYVAGTSLSAGPVAAATSTFAATADTYVDAASPTTNYGTAPQITVDGAPVREAFVRFAVTGVTTRVVTARLRLQVRASAGSGSTGVGVVRSMTDTS